MPFPAVTMRQIGTDPVQSVNGRDLHAFLQVGKVFAAWINERIDQFNFQAGTDFEVFSGSGNNPSGGRPQREYALSIDMAKELAMVERTPKGRQVRLYFIECEKQAKDAVIAAMPDLNDPATLRTMLLQSVDKNIALQGQVAALTPKAEALDVLVATDDMILITDGAKRLGIQPKDLFAYLREHAWIYRRGGSKRDIAHEAKIRQGLLVHKYNPVPQDNGTTIYKEQVRLTPKGLAKLAELLGREVMP